MGSLQDQLLKAGLVSEEQLERSKRDNRRPSDDRAGKDVRRGRGGRGKRRGSRGSGEMDLARAYSERAQLERREKAAEKRQREQEARRRRELKQQLKELVAGNSLNDANAELPRYFEYRGRIRKIYVTQAQRDGLQDSELGIAVFAGRYHIVSAAVIEALNDLAPENIALFGPSEEPAAPVEGYEDERFQVPDDLMW